MDFLHEPSSERLTTRSVFAGGNASGRFNEAWTFDGATWPQTSALPGPRSAAAMAYDRYIQSVVLFGGFVAFEGPGLTTSPSRT